MKPNTFIRYALRARGATSYAPRQRFMNRVGLKTIAMANDMSSNPRADHPRFFCEDCDVDTYVNEQFYMLHDELWDQVASDVDTLLCLNCFEKRLGRPLYADDFASVPLNEQQARVCPELAV